MKIVKGKLTKKMWIEDEDGRRITDKYYYVENYKTKGKFILINAIKTDDICAECDYFVFDASTKQLLAFSESSPRVITDELFEWQNFGKTFWSDSMGRIVREDMRYCARYEQEKLIQAKKNSLCYFLNYDLEEVAGPYESVSSFDKFGYATVEFDSILSVINKKLEVILTTDKYGWLKALSEQYFLTEHNGKYGVIDITGKEIIPYIYDSVALVSGYFKVEYKGKLGLMDKDGKTIFDCIYPEIIETPDKFFVQDFAKLECIKTKEVAK